MAKQNKYKLIRDESLRDLMIVHYQQSYAIQLLSYICYKHNLDTALSVAEACGVLGIDEMRARVKSWAGAFQAGTESAARLQTEDDRQLSGSTQRTAP